MMVDKEIPVDRIKPDPRIQNPRGNNYNTVDLQPTIRKHGVVQRIIVYEGDDDYYYLVAGSRRWTAARQVGMKTVPCRILDSKKEEEILELVAQTNLFQPIPAIILKGTETVGGNSQLAHRMNELDVPRTKIGNSIGCTPDVATALINLYDDMIEVREAVANGRMDITVYSLIKFKPDALKLFVCARQGKITAKFVREVNKNWDSIKDKLEDVEEEEPVVSEVLSEVRDEVVKETVTPARHLNEALHHLRMVTEVTVEAAHIVDYLHSELERLENVLHG